MNEIAKNDNCFQTGFLHLIQHLQVSFDMLILKLNFALVLLIVFLLHSKYMTNMATQILYTISPVFYRSWFYEFLLFLFWFTSAQTSKFNLITVTLCIG